MPAGDGERVAPPPPAYIPVVWDGTLPTPQGRIAQELSKISLEDQRENATTLFNFIKSTPRNNLLLNEASNPIYVALINLPKSKKVRVVFSFGFGTSGLQRGLRDIDGQPYVKLRTAR